MKDSDEVLWVVLIAAGIAIWYFFIRDDYSYISISDKEITVTMQHPSVGITGMNAVHWSDDPDDVGREIYESFVGPIDSWKKGKYVVKVYWKGNDRYGKETKEYAGSFDVDAEEMRKYESYQYSKNYRDVPRLIHNMAFQNGR